MDHSHYAVSVGNGYKGLVMVGRDHRYSPQGWILHKKHKVERYHAAKSRYQRRKLRMQARFWRRVFSPRRAFTEGFKKGLKICSS